MYMYIYNYIYISNSHNKGNVLQHSMRGRSCTAPNSLQFDGFRPCQMTLASLAHSCSALSCHYTIPTPLTHSLSPVLPATSA